MFFSRFECYVGLRDGIPVVDIGITCEQEVERFLLGMTVSEIERAEEYKGKTYPQINENLLRGQQFQVSAIFALIFPTRKEAMRYLDSLED